MKNLLLSIFSLLTFVSYSQDLAKYRSMTEDEVLTLSNSIAQDIRDDWQMYLEQTKEKGLYLLWYIPKSTDSTMLKKIEKVGIATSGVDHFIVKYEMFYEGRDLDMEIEGTKKYNFSSLELKFIDAFKIWEKYFLNGATIENVKNYKDKRRKENGEGNSIWMYKFEKLKSPYWRIFKFY